jgi:predicted outer membrane repeat protein
LAASAGTGIDKLFSINPLGAGAGFDTSISNLTITFGKNPSAAGSGDEFGGALDWSAGSDGAGNLALTSCIITQNATTDGDGGGIALSNPGGSGTVTITNSSFTGNVANTSTTGNGGVGGGILVGSFTSLTMTNSQVLNNQAPQATGAQGKGGGINLGAFSHSNIHSSTISGNQAAGNGGGIWSNQGLTIDQSSIISLNTAGGNGGGIWSDNQDIDLTALSKVTVTGNSATGSGGGIHVDTSAPQTFNINFSRIVGNSAAAGSGFDNPASAQVDATDDWWGCNQGPSTAPCDTVNDPNTFVTFDPWIVLNHTPTLPTILVGNSTTLTASFLKDNHGAAISVGNLSALIGVAILFNNPVLGTLSAQQTTIQASGTATATFTGNAPGAGHADAVVDSATVTANITVQAPPDLTITKTHVGNFTQGQGAAFAQRAVVFLGPAFIAMAFDANGALAGILRLHGARHPFHLGNLARLDHGFVKIKINRLLERLFRRRLPRPQVLGGSRDDVARPDWWRGPGRGFDVFDRPHISNPDRVAGIRIADRLRASQTGQRRQSLRTLAANDTERKNRGGHQ